MIFNILTICINTEKIQLTIKKRTKIYLLQKIISNKRKKTLENIAT